MPNSYLLLAVLGIFQVPSQSYGPLLNNMAGQLLNNIARTLPTNIAGTLPKNIAGTLSENIAGTLPKKSLNFASEETCKPVDKAPRFTLQKYDNCDILFFLRFSHSWDSSTTAFEQTWQS